MKLRASVRSASAGLTAHAWADNLGIYKDAVQPQISEPVIATCAFARQGMMAEKLAGHMGHLPYLIARKRGQMHAGGLPQHFIIAVTTDRVYAIERKLGPGRDMIGEIRGEVAQWDRDSLRVASTPDQSTGGLGLNVTIESPAEGETVHCCVGRGPLSEDFLTLLADPKATARASTPAKPEPPGHGSRSRS